MANSLLYGFLQLKDIATTRAVELEGGRIREAIGLSVAEHNAQINTLLNLFAEPTTEYSGRFTPAANSRLQPGNQFSRALPFKGSSYDLAWPLQQGDAAWGANYVTAQKMTVRQVNDNVSNMLTADVNWMADHVLAALFYNGSGWTFTDETLPTPTLTIKGLANGDTTTYSRIGGSAATDTHYLAQAAAIADATNPFTGIYTELIEHPENMGAEIISFISPSNTAAVTGLASFVELQDENVRAGNANDVVTGTPNTSFPGRLLGRVANQWVAEWPRIPADYIVAVAAGATPLRMRQDPEPQLQGFAEVAVREDHPWWESQWMRRAGFGAYNRVGAVVQRVGNGSYAIPTSYGSPMA
jgi:hypothetical protein